MKEQFYRRFRPTDESALRGSKRNLSPQQSRIPVVNTDPLPSIDVYGRRIHKMRLQLTDACNFRCFYCMPLDVKFMPRAKVLGAAEMLDICADLVDLGIDEIRVSGGEPTLRTDLEQIIDGLSGLPVLKLGITSNGYCLEKRLSFLKQTRCQHINISLDSLREDRFRTITKTNNFKNVYSSVLRAKAMGFFVKVNVVVLRGINDDEIFDFIQFSSQYGIEVRFLELMKIGPQHTAHSHLFVSAKEILEKIEKEQHLFPLSVNCDSTSFNFKTSTGGRIGFIASESQPFCGFCSRLRLTASGTLRACLMSNAGINLCGRDKSEYPRLLKSVISMKPVDRIAHVDQPMYQIGG